MPDSFSLLCDVTVITSVNEIKMVMHINTLSKDFISPSTVFMYAMQKFGQQNTSWCKRFVISRYDVDI